MFPLLLKELERNQFSDVERTTDGHLRQLKTSNIELEARCSLVVFMHLFSSFAYQSCHFNKGDFCFEK